MPGPHQPRTGGDAGLRVGPRPGPPDQITGAGHFQPARSISLVASALSSPRRARFRVSALKVPQAARVAPTGTPGATGYSPLASAYQAWDSGVGHELQELDRLGLVLGGLGHRGAADVHMGARCPSWFGQKTPICCAAALLRRVRGAQHPRQVVGVGDGQVALTRRRGLDLVAVAALGGLARLATRPLAQVSVAAAPSAAISEATRDWL